MTAARDAIDTGRYRVEERVALETHVTTGTAERVLKASNDVVLLRVTGHRQAELAVSIGGQLFSRYVGDGLILSTPTGSTAYALSAGGPILSPRTHTLLVTPLAPHDLANRTLIVDAGDRIEIEVLDGSAPLVIERDGGREGEVTVGSRIIAARSAPRRPAHPGRMDELLQPSPAQAPAHRPPGAHPHHGDPYAERWQTSVDIAE